MKRKTLVLVMLLALGVGVFLSLPSRSPGANLLKRQIKQMNKIAAALESGRDPSPLNEKLDELARQFEELDIDDDVRMELVEQHSEEYAKATARLMSASITAMMTQSSAGKAAGWKLVTSESR